MAGQRDRRSKERKEEIREATRMAVQKWSRDYVARKSGVPPQSISTFITEKGGGLGAKYTDQIEEALVSSGFLDPESLSGIVPFPGGAPNPIDKTLFQMRNLMITLADNEERLEDRLDVFQTGVERILKTLIPQIRKRYVRSAKNAPR